MNKLDVLFIGSVMNYDGSSGSLANYIRHNGKWIAPFQYIYQNRRHIFESEAAACVYDIPNLSICELVDYLKRRMDLNYHIVWHFNYHRQEILEILRNSPPRLVAISSTLAFFPEYLKDCIAWFNAHKTSETRIVVGGKWLYSNYKQCGATAKLEKVLDETGADYYVINLYGQETLYRLLLAEKAGDVATARGLPNVASRRNAAGDYSRSTSPNCAYEGRNYRINVVANEDHTPGQPMLNFANIDRRFMQDVAHVQTAYSCPFKCRFCTFPALAGKHRLYDLDAVIAQLKQLKNMGVKYLFFIDDTFNVPLKRFETLLDRMIAERLDMQWVSFFRAQFSNADVVRKMYAAGCRMAFCGIESGNDDILKRMNKRVTVRHYEKGIEYLHRAGITPAASYFIGYPGETYDTAMDTLRLLNDPRIVFSRGSVFYYDPEAPVGDHADEYGLTGFGAEWRHKTMNSKEAAAIHLEIVGKLKNVNVQTSDGAGWSIFHLFSKGLSMDDIKLLYREFNEIQKKQIEVAGKSALNQYRVFGKRKKLRKRLQA